MLLVVGGFDAKHNLRDTWAYSTEELLTFMFRSI